MATTRSEERTEQTKHPHDKMFMENTLLRIADALFCHDAKRAPTRTEEIHLNKGIKEKTIVIRPDPRLGQPGPLAHKVFVALIKKHSDYGRPVQKEISFTKREIMRMVGRKTWGGSDSEELCRALHEIHYTFVKTHFKDNDARFIEHSFNVFPQIWIERRELASDPIEACTITLADPIVASLQDEHFTCLNHALMVQLGTIGQALYMRLFFHLANLYDGANRQRLVFQKRYDDICTEWLGGLTILAHRSKIVGEQLGHHLDQLVAAGFLSSYLVEGAKTQGKDGFTITFRPGAMFFGDYDRFYRRQQQARSQWEPSGDRSEISEPLKVAYLFAEKRPGTRPTRSPSFHRRTWRRPNSSSPSCRQRSCQPSSTMPSPKPGRPTSTCRPSGGSSSTSPDISRGANSRPPRRCVKPPEGKRKGRMPNAKPMRLLGASRRSTCSPAFPSPTEPPSRHRRPPMPPNSPARFAPA